jgi:hypothetical protein
MMFRTLLAAALAAAPAAAGRFDPRDAPGPLRDAVLRAERAIHAAACDAERRFGGVGGEAPYVNGGEAGGLLASASRGAEGAAAGDPDSNAARCEGASEVPGVAVGRTSARLRNPENAPPAWAKAYVAATDGKKAADVAPVAFDLGDRVGLLRPIEIRKRCLSCHAARDEVPASTRAWLARSYPEDRAFGYALGDLRGFWWAEAPKEAAPAQR